MIGSNKEVLGFNKRTTEYNLTEIRKGRRPYYNCFAYYNSPCELPRSNYQLLPGNTDTASYKKNGFQGTIPKKSVLYFTKESKFPRTKLSLTDYKRCIKVDKANYIVVDKEPNVGITSEPYYLFETDFPDRILAIEASSYSTYFNLDAKQLLNFITTTDGVSSITQTYYGSLKCSDNIDFIDKYNSGEYKVPFVYDTALDDLINNSLPDPKLDELLTIKDMLASTDKGIIKLGAQMVAGFNVSKFPLTFRLLLYSNPNWFLPYYGGSSVIIKQLKQTLNIINIYKGNYAYNLNFAEENGVAYSQDDIDLAKELAKNIQWVQESDGCFSDKIWCPDEYKTK